MPSRPCLPILLLAVILLAGTGQEALAHDVPRSPTRQDERAAEDLSAAADLELWGCPMCETVRVDHPGTCPRCGMDLVRMNPLPAGEGSAATGANGESPRPGSPGAEGRRGTGSSRKELALMPGVPTWLFFGSAIGVLALSFILFELWSRRGVATGGSGRRLDLLRIPGLKALIRRRWFQFSLQLPIFLLFTLVVFAGLFGNPAPERNIAPALTWAIWWTWLTLVILFLGKVWCTVCPWMAIADWISKRSLTGNGRRPVTRGIRWPRRLRNIWIATILFVLLTWLELGYGVTQKPWLTAVLALAMVAASLGTLLVFERKAFCRYACLVGRVSGLYSMFAATELRAANRDVCRKCSSKDCYRGNGKAYACPTHQFMGAMEVNTYCTLCTECIKACPEDNIVWNVRPLGSDLFEPHKVRADEGYLAVVMLSMSAFHGLTMTPSWGKLVGWIGLAGGVNDLVAFSTGMAGILLLPLILYYGICVLMKWFAGDREHSAKYLFVRFAYSLLPIALFYHLAHNLQHIFFEGMKIVRLASDPFGWGWDLFGTAGIAIRALLPVDIGWGIQIGLILVGHVFGILIAHKVAVSLYDSPRTATLSQLPILLAMLLFSFQSLWLLSQPMMMRTAM